MICKACGIDKPISAFYTDKTVKSGLMSKCKECTKKRVKEYARKNKEHISEYHKQYHLTYKEEQKKQNAQYKRKIQDLKTPCVKCGETRLYVIDFHHVNPSQKQFNINRKTSKTNFSIIENEASKCVSLCRNCHAEFHYFYGQNPEKPVEALHEYLNKEWSENVINGLL